MRLLIGENSARGSIKRFSSDFLEMPVTDAMPKARTLREMRAGRPELTFTLRLHPDVALTGREHEDVARACAAVEALGAPVVVIPSGPRFTPTKSNLAKLKDLTSELAKQGAQIAWEPRGVFAPEEAESWAETVQALLVRDLTREHAAPGSVVYTRILPFGVGARVTQSGREHLLAEIEGAETAYVVAPREAARSTRVDLRNWLGLEEG